MTGEQLRVRLSTDPDFIFSYIYGNNPDAVIANLRALGLTINNVDDVFRAINDLHASGADDKLIEAFSVAILTDQMSPAELAVVTDVLASQYQAQQGGPKRKVELSTEAWVGIAGLAVGLIGALSGKPLQPQGTNQQQQQQQQQPAQGVNPWMIGLGVAAVALVLFLILRKKK